MNNSCDKVRYWARPGIRIDGMVPDDAERMSYDEMQDTLDRMAADDLPDDFALRVEGEGMAPTLHDGDLALVKRAALTPDMIRAAAVVIRKGDGYRLGRVALLPDGSWQLFSAGDSVFFAPADFLGPVVAVQHSFNPTPRPREWEWAELEVQNLPAAAAPAASNDEWRQHIAKLLEHMDENRDLEAVFWFANRLLNR